MSIDLRKNANVLTAVHKFAKPKERTDGDPYAVDEYELHARPELADRLKNLMACSTPGARLEFAFGIPVLLLKSVPRAEQSLVTMMRANRTQSYGDSGTLAAWTTRKSTRLRHRPKLGSAPHAANFTLARQ
jgi:hypothetical protein